MKHFSSSFRFKKGLGPLLLCLLILAPLLAGLISVFDAPQKVYAAVPTDTATVTKAAVIACGKNNNFSSQKDYDAFAKTEKGKLCVNAFVSSYKDPSVGNLRKLCTKTSDPNNAYCLQGKKLGPEARTAAEKASGGTATTPDSGVVKAATEADACQTGAGKDSCIAGYIAGYKGTLTKSQICSQNKTITANGKTYKVTDISKCNAGFTEGSQGSTATASPKSTPPATASDNKQLDCDAKFTNPLTWVLCPVIDTLATIVDGLDSIITAQLSIESSDIFCNNGDTCEAYYTAWQTFRNIAIGFLIIVGLVVVISQVMGSELLDAYTIRKMLPRILIAAIAITLSWSLMQLAVEVTNDLGYGIRHLIYLPFAKIPNTVDLSFGGVGADFFFGGAIVGGAVLETGAAVALFELSGGVGALVAYAGTAALAVFIAVVVLILRQIAIILMILLSPIAIVAYVLPNTQRVYKIWWESFSKALLMFPLIAAFIATGRVFSAIAIHNGGALNQLIAFIAYFAPYFMIPLTFRLAGSFVGQMGNFVNQRGQAGFKALGDFRGRRRQAGFKRLQDGNLFKGAPEGSRRARLSERYQKASLFNPDEVSLTKPGRWGSELGVLQDRHNLARTKEALESAEMAPTLGDDDANRAGMLLIREGRQAAYAYLDAKVDGDGNKLYSHDEIERKLDHNAMLRKKFGDAALKPALVASNVMASTAYNDTQDAIGELVSDIDWASGGDDQIRAQLIGQVKQRASQAQRGDLAAPFTDMYMQSKIIGQTTNAADRAAAISHASEVLEDAIVHTEGAGYVAGQKGKALENLMPALQRRIERSAGAVWAAEEDMDALTRGEVVVKRDAQGNEYHLTEEMAYQNHDAAGREMKRSLAATAALHDVVAQISDEKAGMLADGLLGAAMPYSGGNATILQTVDGFRGDDEFFQFRNDYQHRYSQDAERAIASQQPPMGTPGGPAPAPRMGPMG